MESVITNDGFLKSSDVRSKQEFGFKFKTIGARISEGDLGSLAGSLVYNNPGPEPNISEMKKLVSFTGGTSFPGGQAKGDISLTAQPTDTEIVTISDGIVVTVFEFDDNVTVSPGNITVTIGATLSDTANNLRDAINGLAGVSIDASRISFTGPVNEVVLLVNTVAGTAGNVLITTTGVNVTPTGMSGGDVNHSTLGQFLPVITAVPIAGTEENPGFSMVYEFVIDPETVSSPINIREVGLFGQRFIETSVWDPTSNYVIELDYVTFGGSTWKTLFSVLGATVWISGSTFSIGDKVSESGKFWASLTAHTGIGTPPTSDPTNWVEDLNHQPSLSSTIWTQVDGQEKTLLEFGEPYLLFILARINPLIQSTENATRLTLTISFDKTISEVFFDNSDSGGLTESQLDMIEAQVVNNRNVRINAMKIDVLKQEHPGISFDGIPAFNQIT